MPDASSKAQQRFLFAAERRGDLPRGTAKRKAKSGPAFARLPERATSSKTRRGKQARYATRPLREIKRRVARRRG